MEVRGEGEFQQHTPTSSDLDPGKNIADEIVRVLEGSLKELRVAVNRELDLAKAKRQIDALVRQTADSPVVRDVKVNLRNLVRMGSKVAREVKKLQPPQNTPPEPPDQLSNAIKDEMSKIVVLNKAVASLRNVRNALLSRQREVALEFVPLHKELNAAVAAIETSLNGAFNRAQVRVEANELNFQKELAKLRVDVGGAQSILQSIPDVLASLGDKETDFVKAVGLYTRFAKAQEMAHKTQEALAHLEMEKYTVAPEGVSQTRNALDNLDLVIKEEETNQGNVAPLQVEKRTDQPNESGICHQLEDQAV